MYSNTNFSQDQPIVIIEHSDLQFMVAYDTETVYVRACARRLHF